MCGDHRQLSNCWPILESYQLIQQDVYDHQQLSSLREKEKDMAKLNSSPCEIDDGFKVSRQVEKENENAKLGSSLLCLKVWIHMYVHGTNTKWRFLVYERSKTGLLSAVRRKKKWKCEFHTHVLDTNTKCRSLVQYLHVRSGTGLRFMVSSRQGEKGMKRRN